MMDRRTHLAAGIVLALASLTGARVSTPVEVTQRTPVQLGVDPRRIELAPLDYVRFCMNYSQECRLGTPNAIIALTPEVNATIGRINRDVNRRIKPVRDVAGWRINPAFGNCNDYVVTKRHELMAAGLPASALLIATARTPSGEGHLVLTVRTDRGDLVLDNLAPEIRHLSETDYAWLKRQSAADPVIWEKM